MNRAVSLWLLRIGVGLVAAAALAAGAGARINTTASFPLGLYWETEDPPVAGALVFFCPPPTEVLAEAVRRGYIGAGFCPGGTGYLIKKVVAAGGDSLAVTDRGVCVNGEWIPNSAPFAVDPAGRPMPRYRTWEYTLRPSEVLLLSDVNPLSFDGRYFGPVEVSMIRGVIQPVVTW